MFRVFSLLLLTATCSLFCLDGLRKRWTGSSVQKKWPLYRQAGLMGTQHYLQTTKCIKQAHENVDWREVAIYFIYYWGVEGVPHWNDPGDFQTEMLKKFRGHHSDVMWVPENIPNDQVALCQETPIILVFLLLLKPKLPHSKVDASILLPSPALTSLFYFRIINSRHSIVCF